MSTQCNGPVKETDMSKVIGELYLSVESLEERMKVLLSRLESVLVSKPACTDDKKEPGCAVQCSLAKDIRGAVTRIDKLKVVVNSTLEDLEL